MKPAENLQPLVAATTDERHRAVLDRVFDAIISVTPDLLVEDFNRAATKLFGYELEQIRGRPLFDVIIPPHMRERGLEVFRKLRQGEGPVADEAQVQAKDGGLSFDVTELP